MKEKDKKNKGEGVAPREEPRGAYPHPPSYRFGFYILILNSANVKHPQVTCRLAKLTANCQGHFFLFLAVFFCFWYEIELTGKNQWQLIWYANGKRRFVPRNQTMFSPLLVVYVHCSLNLPEIVSSFMPVHPKQ